MTIRLRPNRSLSRRGLRCWGWTVTAVTVAIAMVGAQQGNVFAPLFALLEAAGVSYALTLAWRAGDRGERITVDARALVVEYLPGHRRARFQSYWVRVLLQPARGRQRLVLASHGSEVEVGAFLVDEERAELSRTLRGVLAEAKAPRRGPGDN